MTTQLFLIYLINQTPIPIHFLVDYMQLTNKPLTHGVRHCTHIITMDITTQNLNAAVAGVIGILLVSYYAYFSRKATDAQRKPPLAAGGRLLIGHLHLLGTGGSDHPPYITLGALADKYGSIFSIRIGVHNAVVVSTWELAKEIFTSHDVIISSRPKFTAAKILGHDYANFGFSPYGDYWREMRKITASELLSTRRFESLRSIRDSEVKRSLKELMLYREKSEGWLWLL